MSINYEREYQKMSDVIGIIRNITVLLVICVLGTVVGFLFVPGAIDQLVKIYIIAGCGALMIFALVALVLARSSSIVTLFFTAVAQLFAGLFLGVAIISVVKII